MSSIARAVALCVLLVASAAAARPFTLDDLVKVESLGGAYLAPGGRWLVIARTAPYDTARAYDDDGFVPMALSRLEVVDLTGAKTAEPLLPGPAGDGLNPGPFSPDGRTMAVFRLHGHHWQLGLADLARRQVRWLGVTVEPANWGRSVQWRSNRELVAIAMADGAAPTRFDRLWAQEARPPARWAAATAGVAATDTVVGSGRFLALTPSPPRTVLLRIDAASGAARPLARGAFIDLEVSPGGGYVAALGEEAPHQPWAGEVLRTGTTPYRRGLTVVDLASGAAARPCGDLDLASHLLSWSPSGRALLMFARVEGREWESGSLRTVEPAQGRCGVLAAPGLRPAILYGQEGFPMVRADWMGEDPVVLSEPDGARNPGRRDWRRWTARGALNLTAAAPAAPPTLIAVDASGILFLGGDGLWRSDAQGHARRLSADFDKPVLEAGPGEGDRLAYVAARDRSAWVSDGGRIARASGDGVGGSRSLPSSGAPLVATPDLVVSKVTDGHGVSTLFAQSGGDRRPLLQVNVRYGDITFSKLVATPFTGPHGERLTAWLYLPPDLPPGTKAPLVVVPYPGVAYPSAPRAYAPGSTFAEINPHLLTAAGYAVLVASMPRDPSSHEPAAGLADEVLAAVDAAARIAPIDPHRLALWGHSFGGYAALAIAAQTGRFASVIEASGKSDLISAYGPFLPAARSAPEDGTSSVLTMGWMENGQGDLGLSPWQDVLRYARNSPMLQADRITAPVLMIHGDLDFVPLAQGEEMFSALYRQNKDAVLVTLWGEGHLATSPANIRKMYAWILWWLGRTLGPGASSTQPLGGGPAPLPGPGFDGQQLEQARREVAP
jgi:dipeptidyl aminopeptidase/acylaminoacyl peptidase